jgi:hypothetical protein
MSLSIIKFLKFVFSLYYDGFVNMKVGKTLWIIIFIKLFIMFFIMKIFFFPNILKENFATDRERSIYILTQLTKER